LTVFDLGAGMLFGVVRDEERRREMLLAVAPIWEGNETWLIVAPTPPHFPIHPADLSNRGSGQRQAAVSAA
jgi:hypothetical protein